MNLTIGESVRLLRLRARLSQAALAKKAGVSRNTIGLLERDELNVTIGTLSKVCDALGFDFVVSVGGMILPPPPIDETILGQSSTNLPDAKIG